MPNDYTWRPENELAWIMEQVERRACFMVEENRKLHARLAEAEAQRDELKAALELIRNMDHKSAATNCFVAKAVDIASRALAALTK